MEFTLSDPAIFRSNISNHFMTMVNNDETLGRNIEIGLYNYSINEANLRHIIKKWTNIKFAEIYASRLKIILYNLKYNPELITQLCDNQITPNALTFMTHQELSPSHWKTRLENKMKRDKSRLSTNIVASTDLFTCKKCKSKKCTYYELQTRSADEPATIFITCLDCGKNWKN